MATTITDRRSGTSTPGATVDRVTAASTGAAYKAPCKVATTASITLAALQSIDGVTLVADDRVLVKDQSTASQNGIYVASSGNWERAPDWDDSRDVVEGTRVWVTDGSVNGQSEFVVTSADPIVPGTTSVTIEASNSIAGGALLAANNLSDVADPFTSLRNLMENGTTIVSANPLVLTSAGGDFVDVSGNTSFSAVTLAEGKGQWVRFTGTPTITVGASLIGNGGGSNVVLAAGDIVYFRGYASSVVRFIVFRLSGKAVVPTVAAADLPSNVALLDTADQTVTGGARVTSSSLGTVSSGTVTLDPGDRPHQHYTNNGAHTLAPGSNGGSLTLQITNGASAGAITTSGYTKVVGAFTTTNGDDFLCTSIVINGFSLLTIQALQ